MRITKVGIPSGGTTSQVLVKNSNTDYDVTWGAGGGGGTPGGSNTQVQFNDSGSFNGDSGLTYNKTTDELTAGSVKITTINNATTDTDKFLVSDAGVIKYRTGAEVLSDIGVSESVGSKLYLFNAY